MRTSRLSVHLAILVEAVNSSTLSVHFRRNRNVLETSSTNVIEAVISEDIRKYPNVLETSSTTIDYDMILLIFAVLCQNNLQPNKYFSQGKGKSKLDITVYYSLRHGVIIGV